MADADGTGMGKSLAVRDGASTGTEPIPVVMTVEELASLLRVNRKTAYAAVNAGEIPGARRIGNAIRLHRDTVLAWIAAGQARVPRPRRKP